MMLKNKITSKFIFHYIQYLMKKMQKEKNIIVFLIKSDHKLL